MRSLAVASILCLSLPAAAESLGDALRAGAKGQPVYVTAGGQGIVAHSLDGRLKQPLVKGAVRSAILDPVWELVWYVADRKLWVLDLREPAGTKPIAVVTGYPEAHGFEIQFDDGNAYYTGDGNVILTLAGENPNVYFDDDTGNGDPRLKVVGEKWLLANAARKDRESAAGTVRESNTPADPVPLALCNRNDEASCGDLIPFAGKDVYMVVVPAPCRNDGGDCAIACALYDARTKKFAELDKGVWQAKLSHRPRAKCTPELAPGNAAWISGKAVCNGSTCREEADRPLGWLDRGDTFDPFAAVGAGD